MLPSPPSEKGGPPANGGPPGPFDILQGIVGNQEVKRATLKATA